MSGHDHGHGHGHGGDDHHHHDHAEHDHSNDLTPALQYNLYKQIDFEGITTYNEASPGSGKAIVKKEWKDRLNSASSELESDADEQILMHVPFTGQIKLHAILLRTSESPSAPRTLKLFRNRNDLDFTAVSDMPAHQTLDLPRHDPSLGDVMEIPVNRAQWNTTTSVDLFFEDNHGDGDEDVTRIAYLGFKGEYMALNREPVTFLYEAAAQPGDHKLIQGLTNTGSSGLGQ